MQECDQFVYDNRLSTAALPPGSGLLRIPPALLSSTPTADGIPASEVWCAGLAPPGG
jgi:hypothetical protein